jgi:hypothetical protein
MTEKTGPERSEPTKGAPERDVEDIPTSEELDVEAPNESAPGHNPTPTEDDAEPRERD